MIPSACRFQVIGLEGQRRPDLCVVRVLEPGRHYTDDGIARPIDLKPATHDSRFPAESPLPKAVTQEHNLIVPGFRLLRQEGATPGSFCAQNPEKAGRNHGRLYPLGGSTHTKISAGAGDRCNPRETLVQRLQVLELWSRDRVAVVR